MSVITQLSQTDPNYAWIVGSLPLAVTIDLAIGNVPGRSHAIRGLNWLIGIVESGVTRSVVRLGGGRGAELCGGVLVTTMVVGSAASLTWLAIDLADTIGGPASLVTRTGFIAAGLVIRSTGDRINLAAEASNLAESRKYLTALTGAPAGRIDRDGVNSVCVAAVGELASSGIVAPLCWLAVGGPAGLWGFLAARSLRQVQLARVDPNRLASRVPAFLTDLAEWLPAILNWLLLGVSAGLVRLNPRRAIEVGWKACWLHPGIVSLWGQGAVAGALGIRIVGGRVFGSGSGQPHPPVGESLRPVEQASVVLAVRMMQITAIMAAGLAAIVTLFW